MKNFIFLFLLLLSQTFIIQNFDNNLINGLKPHNIGPSGISESVTSIDVVQNNPDIMYVGTAAEYLWKSTSVGIKWILLLIKKLQLLSEP